METNDAKIYSTRILQFFRDDVYSSKALDTSKMGLLFFAVATIAFGIQNFIFGDFVMGRAPAWPSSIFGKLVWAYTSGVMFVTFGVAIVIGKRSVMAAISIAVLVFAWALLRHLLAAHWNWGTEITQTGKALVLWGGALCAAGILQNKTSISPRVSTWLILTGRLSIGSFFIICGIEHFMFVDFVKSLVPAWIPGSVFWTYLAGVALIAGGIGMMIRPTTRLAALLSGTMVFLWLIVLHIPRAITSQDDGNEWVAVVEALAVSGIAFMISARSTFRH